MNTTTAAPPKRDLMKIMDVVLKFAVVPLIGVLITMNRSIGDLSTNLVVLIDNYKEFKEDGVRAIVKDIISPMEHRLTKVEEREAQDSSDIKEIRSDVKRLLEKRK